MRSLRHCEKPGTKALRSPKQRARESTPRRKICPRSGSPLHTVKYPHTTFDQDDLPAGDNFAKGVTWSAGVEYFLSRNFSLMGSYDNRFGAGGGLSARF